MRSLVTEIIPERLGGVTTDFPDSSFQNEAAGVLPTPVLQEFMNCYHYSALRAISEAGITLNDLTDNITDNQQWDAFVINTRNAIYNALGLSTALPRIVSGEERLTSSLPDFLRADGAALEFTLLATTTDLELEISNAPVTIEDDIVETGITAAPSTNNTAAINDASVSNDLYAGETDAVIRELTIGTVGSEISSRVGQIAAFRTPTGEILQALIKDATTLTNVFRGYYFDDSGDPIVRQILSDTNVITLMEIGWVFAEDDGTTLDVSYTTPVISFVAPAAPASGDYWLDTEIKEWNKYNGATWDIVNVALIGQIISDDTNTIASRSGDFSKQFDQRNNIELEIFSTEVIKAKNQSAQINVYGSLLDIDLTKLTWDITSDLESPIVEAISTYYFEYITSDGELKLSDEKPYYRPDLQGYYHPYNSWRCVGVSYNDGSGDFAEERNYFMYQKYNPNKKTPNTFSAYIQNNGTATILEQSPPRTPCLLSVNRVSNGIVEFLYKTGFFLKSRQSIHAQFKGAAPGSGFYSSNVQGITSSGFEVRMVTTGNAVQDKDFMLTITSLDEDYADDKEV